MPGDAAEEGDASGGGGGGGGADAAADDATPTAGTSSSSSSSFTYSTEDESSRRRRVAVEGGSFRVTTDADAAQFIRDDLPEVRDKAFDGGMPWKLSAAARLMRQAQVVENRPRPRVGAVQVELI